jgi:thioredoxin 1
MSKFGELINSKVAVLIMFYTDWNDTSNQMLPVIRNVSAIANDTVKVVKIDVDKNQELADALRIKGLPTFMIYKDGQMLFRQLGEMTELEIIERLNEYK